MGTDKSLDSSEITTAPSCAQESGIPVAFNLAFENSSMDRPWTISHLPPLHLTGKEKMMSCMHARCQRLGIDSPAVQMQHMLGLQLYLGPPHKGHTACQVDTIRTQDPHYTMNATTTHRAIP